MIQKAWDCIKLNNMIEKGDRIVVGVSGGADSVCLLHVLEQACKELEASMVVVHINHGIRGEEAARDEQFVKALCNHKNLEYVSYSYQVKRIAKEQGLSEEEAGRKVRYGAFLETCQNRKCNKIAIAHNKNDNAETVLFHLFRGTGIRGLSGIDPKRAMATENGEVILIRPLLAVERKEIEEYLNSNGIEYVTDSTNLTEDYTRNKIRNRILAYAASDINTGAISNIHEASSLLREAMEYIDSNVAERYRDLVKQEDNVYRITTQDLLGEAAIIQKGIVLKILENLVTSRKDIEAKHVEAVLALMDKKVGRYVHLPYHIIAEKEYEFIKLYIQENIVQEKGDQETLTPIPVEVPGKVLLPQWKKMLETDIILYKKNEPIPKNSCIKWFDYDKIENAVVIRTRREGDYIQVNALGGRKKLKDYFIDRKIPQKLRDSQLLITDGNHVMWIPGEGDRMSEKYKVDDATTKILLMKMIDLEDSNNGTQH